MSAEAERKRIEQIGAVSSTMKVELSTRFLEHFSEQLYSSPQKAFEELISNSWDAGADHVEVKISENLQSPTATMCVLDNGMSMDEAGLRALWHIAFSPKRENPTQYGRAVIGKFGIGKLATYLLASKLTYLCKAADGKIRRVTMDYGHIDQQSGTHNDKLMSDLDLNIFEVQFADVESALKDLDGGGQLLETIKAGFLKSDKVAGGDSEFGGVPTKLDRPNSGTWTLVALSGLKPTGRELKLHVLRRMLQAALPFGSEIAININGERLLSSKISNTVAKTWIIGPDLGLTSFELNVGDAESPDKSSPAADAKDSEDEEKSRKISITSAPKPYPFVEIPGIGKVTGTVYLFEEKISGGKSEERGASNGFHVNVLGRVVNLGDPSFGEENLSHAAWARFRMAIRADGLNDLLTTNREQFKEREEIKIFRAFLRKVFNTARSYYDSDMNLEFPDGGDVLVRSLGVLSLNPLRSVVSETLNSQSPIPGLFDETGIVDRAKRREEWRDATSDSIKNALSTIRYEKIADGNFATFRINDSSIVINKDHPFVVEHSHSRAEKELVRTVAMVTLLTDIYSLDVGVDPGLLKDIRAYRDQLMQFRALQRRQSGTHIAKILLQTQHDSQNSKRMEAAVSDALRYLGFQVRDLAKPGEPEGIASAYSTPTLSDPTEEQPNPPLYCFSFDAKSSKHDSAMTGNIKLDGVVEHRTKFKADYALIVAPGYQDGALAERCSQQKVTPITARDLGRLLEYTVEYGAISVVKFKEIFGIYNPSDVTKWVDDIEGYLKRSRKLTIDIFLQALEILKGKVPDVLPAATIALTCRENLKVAGIKDHDVKALVNGLAILVPDLIGITDDKIVVNASASRVAAAVSAQLEKLKSTQDA